MNFFNHVLFLLSHSVNELYVDDPDKDSGGKIDVSLNISLPNLHCDCEYIHNIYIYKSLKFSAVHFLFVCFPFHIVYGLFFTVCFSLAILIRQYYTCIICLPLSLNTAYWQKINHALDKDLHNGLFTRLCCGMLLDNARL